MQTEEHINPDGSLKQPERPHTGRDASLDKEDKIVLGLAVGGCVLPLMLIVMGVAFVLFTIGWRLLS